MQKYFWTLVLLSSLLTFALKTCQQPSLEATWSPKLSPPWLQSLKDSEVMALSTQPEVLKTGKKLFANNCAACHGGLGQGKVCSSLIDGVWQFSDGTPTEILKTAWWGVPNQGMPSWAKLLSATEFKALGAYLVSLQPTESDHE